VDIQDDPKLYQARGLVYTDLEAYHRAIKDFDQAVSLQPGASHLYYFRGMAHKHLGFFEKVS